VTGTDWPAVKVSPELIPLTVKAAPVTFTADIVTLEFPMFVKAAPKSLLLPTLTLPKLRLDVLNVSSWVPATPAPLNPIVNGELGALLMSATEPVTLPAALGAKTTLNVALEPVGIVSGMLRPVMLKPVPVTVACEITTLAVPPFVRLIVCELLFPVETFPKATVPGTAPSCAWIPVPLKAIVNGELGALLEIAMLPVLEPVVVGANCALNETLSPAAIVAGNVRPLIPKALPETAARFTAMLLVLVFVNVIVCVPLCPTDTFPKLTVAGEIAKPGCAPVPTSATDNGEFAASLVIVKPPAAEPADSGAKWIWTVLLCPGAIVAAGVPAPVVKLVPVTAV
jgi:hypothetical protein